MWPGLACALPLATALLCTRVNSTNNTPSSTLLVRGSVCFCPPADDARNPAQGRTQNTPENEARCESCTRRPYRGFAGTIARTITFRERRALRKHHVCTASPLDLSVIVPPAHGWGPGQVVAGGLPVPSQEQRGVYSPIPDALSNDPASCMPASVGARVRVFSRKPLIFF
jgi:hypothetical protein